MRVAVLRRLWVSLVLKLGSNGELLWHRAFPNAEPAGWKVTDNAHVFVAGRDYDTDAIFLAELSPDGQLIWQEDREQGGAHNSVTTNEAMLLVVGASLGDPAEVRLVSCPLSAGAPTTVLKTVDTQAGELNVSAMRLRADGTLLLGGSLKGSIDLGRGPVTPSGTDIGDSMLSSQAFRLEV